MPGFDASFPLSNAPHWSRLGLLLGLWVAIGCPAFAQEPSNQAVEEQEVLAQEARDREQSAENDPLAARQAEKAEEKVEEKAAKAEGDAEPVEPEVALPPGKRWSFSWYASPRLRYQVTGDETAFSDDVSRAGVSAGWRIAPRYEIFAALETGFDVFNTLSYWTNPDGQPPENREGDAVFDRLL